MADKTYVVTGACAVVYNADHSAAVTVPRGGTVPPGSDPEHLQLLLDRGLIAEGEGGGGLDVDPDAAPPFPGVVEENARRQSGGYDGTSAPAKSGSKADWTDWATRVANGNPEELAAIEGMTRDQLAENYADKALPTG